MTDKKIFYDSNILIYLVDNDFEKKKKASSLLINDYSYISTQAVNENVNICITKLKLNKEEAFNHGKFLLDKFNLIIIDKEIINKAFEISMKYGYSYWDSLIISSALEKDCDILYSEDMQHSQVIDGRLKIVNPFKIKNYKT
ncbi:MAG: PIN domain-containing protein [Bacteroidota bacterium]|nr:PIN domain-containing protein [Bacteroidota bacterium]